jgi:hypothetical protein
MRATWDAARAREASDPRAAQSAEVRLAVMLMYRGRMAEAARLPHIRKTPLYETLTRFGAVPADSARVAFAPTLAADAPPYECIGGAVALWAVSGDTASVDACARHVKGAVLPDSIPALARVRPFAMGLIEAYRALVRQDTAAAATIFSALPDSLCPWACSAGLESVDRANALAAQGRAREAMFLLDEHNIETGASTVVPIALARARLAVQLGDRERAIGAYGIVARAWARADEPLQPFVAEAHRELARLGGDTREGTRIVPVKR